MIASSHCGVRLSILKIEVDKYYHFRLRSQILGGLRWRCVALFSSSSERHQSRQLRVLPSHLYTLTKFKPENSNFAKTLSAP